MTARRTAFLTAVLVVAIAAAAPTAVAKKPGGTLRVTKPVNALVPDKGPGANDPYGHMTSTIVVGKKFKGRRIRDVNVTVQTSGVSGQVPTNDLDVLLTAPSGATTEVFQNLFSLGPPYVTTIGPLTVDDESPLGLGRGQADNPTELFSPYTGTARPTSGALADLDDGPVRGTWTLEVLDIDDNETSRLDFWKLEVVTGKPYSAPGKKPRPVNIAKSVNAPIPDQAPGNGPFGALTSTIDVGKAYKGTKVRDVNVTVQTAGVSGAEPASDLSARLVAPNGAITPILFTNLEGFGPPVPSIGPLTLDDEAPLRVVSSGPPPNLLPNMLPPPWAGTARPRDSLKVMDDGRVNGSWKLIMVDNGEGQTSNLVSWRLNVVAGRPYRAK